MVNTGRSVRPTTLSERQIRPLVDGNRGVDISRLSRVSQPDQNRQADSLLLPSSRPSAWRGGGSRILSPRWSAPELESWIGRGGGSRRIVVEEEHAVGGKRQ